MDITSFEPEKIARVRRSAASVAQQSIGRESKRYYGLESLRAWMMLLGVWFHASCAYTTLPIGWLYKDPSTSAIFNFPILFIHVFRMPVFFLLAGFFAHLSWRRSGTRSFLCNRAKRILLPFVVSWPILFVVSRLGYFYASSLAPHPASPAWLTSGTFRSAEFLSIFRTMHLWFLYYLMYIYVLFIGLAVIFRACVPARAERKLDALFYRVISSPWRPFLFAVSSFIPLLLTRNATIEADGSFLINPLTLLPYSIFFGVGWVLFGHDQLLPGFRRHAWKQVAGGVLFSIIYFLSIQRSQRTPPLEAHRFHIFAAMFGAVSEWLLIFGLAGLFLRYLNHPSRRMRYLADSSYWIYLVHPPLMIWVALGIRSLPAPATVKFVVLLMITIPILLASYQWCVRETRIGSVLNSPQREPLSTGTLPLRG